MYEGSASHLVLVHVVPFAGSMQRAQICLLLCVDAFAFVQRPPCAPAAAAAAVAALLLQDSCVPAQSLLQLYSGGSSY
jgi:hypothetical protein